MSTTLYEHMLAKRIANETDDPKVIYPRFAEIARAATDPGNEDLDEEEDADSDDEDDLIDDDDEFDDLDGLDEEEDDEELDADDDDLDDDDDLEYAGEEE